MQPRAYFDDLHATAAGDTVADVEPALRQVDDITAVYESRIGATRNATKSYGFGSPNLTINALQHKPELRSLGAAATDDTIDTPALLEQ